MHTVGKPLGTAGAIEYFKKDIRNQTLENGTDKSDKSIDKSERLPELLQTIQQKKDEGENGGDNEDEDESSGDSSEDIILGESITLWQGELAKEFILKEQTLPFPQELSTNPDNDYRKLNRITAIQAFDVVIEAAEKHFNEKGKEKFVTEQNLLAEVLNQSLRDLKIEEIEKEFVDRQARGELDVFKFSQSSRKSEKKVQHTEEASKNIANNKQIDHSKNQTDVELENSNGRIIKPIETEQNERLFSENEKQFAPNGFARTENNSGKSNFANFFDETKSKSGKIDEEKSDFQETLSEMAQASGKQSGKILEKISSVGGESAASRNDRAGDQAIGSGGEIEFDSAEIETNYKGNSTKDSNSGAGKQTQVEFGIAKNRNLEAGSLDAGKQNTKQSERTSEDRTRGAGNFNQGSPTQGVEGNDNLGNRKEIQHTERTGVGEFDRGKSSSDKKDQSSIPKVETERNRDKEFRGGNSEVSEQDQVGGIQSCRAGREIHHEDGNNFGNTILPTADIGYFVDSSNSFGHLRDQQRSDRNDNGIPDKSIFSGKITGSVRGESEAGSGEYPKHDSSSERIIADDQETLQENASRAEQNERKNVEKNPRAAEWATQIINVKFYGGQLDQEVTDKLAMFIKNNYTPEEFIDELIQTKTIEQKDNISRNLDQQLNFLTESFGLPKNDLSGVDNTSLLIEKLTEIEVKNFEETSGEKISLKTVERLAGCKSELNNKLSAEDNSRKSIELFEDTLSGQPVFETELEYKVFE